MPINTDLLIAAPMLQDALVDKDGTPMAYGTVTCYQDNSRTTLKNWYYQSGLPGAYTYIKLPNPLTLSAAGTICDINGVDTIPFFYPYSELDQTERQPYYITIVNYEQTNQITRQNFPFLPDEDNEPGQGSHNNYVINNRFWRNIGTLNLTNVLNTVVCPGQHDGFSSPDVRFIKNVAGGQDTVTFTKFPLVTTPILEGDITPEFYINHTCSNSPVGETQKAYQFPISLHVNTLASVPFTFTIQGQNAGGTAPGQNTINIYIYQDTGTGTTPPVPFLIGSIVLNSSWQKYEITGVFPSTAGLTLSQGGDDGLYLLVQMPLDINCSINFCLPSIYLTTDAPTNSFATYDEIDAVINSPRTGDLRVSWNNFYYYGWVPMNNGTIGNTGSIASTRGNQDTWQLYNLIWTFAKPYDSGIPTNVISQMYNSSGVPVNYGGSAYADFTAGNVLLLPQQLGKVLLGTAPIESMILGGWFQNATITNAAGSIQVNVANGATFFQGQPITFTATVSLPGNIISNYVYYVTNIAGNTCQVAVSYAAAIARAPVVAFGSAGSGVQIHLNNTGVPIGEFGHAQQTAEVGSHLHGISQAGTTLLVTAGNDTTGPLAFPLVGTGNVTTPFNITGTLTSATLANTPNSVASNIVQPGVFYNIFMKL